MIICDDDVCIQVERRVVNQIALAAERGALGRGSAVLLSARSGRVDIAVKGPSDRDFTPVDVTAL